MTSQRGLERGFDVVVALLVLTGPAGPSRRSRWSSSV
jgi:hypothetical protein